MLLFYQYILNVSVGTTMIKLIMDDFFCIGHKVISALALISICSSLIACDGKTTVESVTNNNTPPQITTPSSSSISENTLNVLTISATDADNDALIYSLIGGADQALFSIASSTGVLRFITSPDFEIPTDDDLNNEYNVQVGVSDGQNLISQLITVTVTDVNDINNTAPQITSSGSVQIVENTTPVITVTANDVDGDNLSYTLIGGADIARFSINATLGALSFNTPPNFEAPSDNGANNEYLVQVSVSDGLSAQAQLITVTVTDINDTAPVFTSSASVSIDENISSVITVTTTDADSLGATYSLNGGDDQAQFSINANSGALSFNVAPDFEIAADNGTNNSYQVQVQASDGVNTQNQLITVSVNNTNDNPPVITSSASAAINENSIAVITVTATDADASTLSYSINGGVDQAAFSINPNSGALRFITAANFEAPTDVGSDNGYAVQVSVSDGVSSVNQLINVTVNDVVSEQIVGLPARPDNATCAIADAPVLSSTIQLTQVFSDLSFTLPTVVLQSPVNTDRWYVAEQYTGLIKTFLSADNSSATFADFGALIFQASETGLLGVAFHPNYANNGYVYVYYSTAGGGASVNHQSVIDRYTATSDTVLNMASRLEIMRINQPEDNHNGGNMIFGTDGYLYIGMGDGGGNGSASGPSVNSQDINSLLGKMLRIDVDNTDAANGNNYSSPADNPAGLDEIYAIGLRNPWRWSFDQLTDDLILADVGQVQGEEIDIITKGGNYGWRCYEGTADYNLSGCNLPRSEYIDPIFEYPRSTGKSITGGYVYRGNAIPALYGTYIYSDFFSGPIWGLADPTGVNPTNSSLISSNFNISTFAQDADGEVYVVDFSNGQIFRIDPVVDGGAGNFPSLLSETGCIDATNPLQMAAGLVPYEINAPFWSDGAEKDRWMALPNDSTITIEADGDWTFPINSILVKNFNLNGKRIETRLLVLHADGNWGGYSYEWNAAETDATLLLNGKVINKEGQSYIYPSSTACFQCHTAVTNFVLGPETRQLNRNHLYASTGITANQLSTLESIGYFNAALSDVPANLLQLTEPDDLTASIHDRARAYLYTNCSQCHRSGGPTNVSIDFNITTAVADMNVCNASPDYLIGAASAIMSPGDSANSSLYLRMNCREGVANCVPADTMPPLGSTLVDPQTQVVADWINSLSVCP